MLRPAQKSPARLASPLALLSAALLLGGCASTSIASEASAPEQVSSGEEAGNDARELEKLERDLELSRARLAIAEMKFASAQMEAESRLQSAQFELTQAESELEKFTSVDKPTQVTDAELDLRTAKDRAQEAADELAQIELMYEDQDLDDKHRRVRRSQRGRRNAERAAGADRPRGDAQFAQR